MTFRLFPASDDTSFSETSSEPIEKTATRFGSLEPAARLARKSRARVVWSPSRGPSPWLCSSSFIRSTVTVPRVRVRSCKSIESSLENAFTMPFTSDPPFGAAFTTKTAAPNGSTSKWARGRAGAEALGDGDGDGDGAVFFGGSQPGAARARKASRMEQWRPFDHPLSHVETPAVAAIVDCGSVLRLRRRRRVPRADRRRVRERDGIRQLAERPA